MRFTLRAVLAPLLAALLHGPTTAQTIEAAGYRMPVPALRVLVDAPVPPTALPGPAGDLALLLQTPPLPGIAMLAQPELHLAGLRINPRMGAAARHSFVQGLQLLSLVDGQQAPIEGLPEPLRAADLAWAPDQRHVALTHWDDNGGKLQLWLIDVAARRARLALAAPLHAVAGPGFAWMPDSRRLLLNLRPNKLGPEPHASSVLHGPTVQDSRPDQPARQVRTFPDLLRNAQDERQLEYHLKSQLALVDLQGRSSLLGEPALWWSAKPSPGGAHLLVQRIDVPYSYSLPVQRFARRIDVLDTDGKLLHRVTRSAAVEGLPAGFDSVPLGPREVHWRADAPATLAWVEALDGGDANRPSEVRDQLTIQPAPFDRPAVPILRMPFRYAWTTWGDGNTALVTERWWRSRSIQHWRVAPDKPERAAVRIYSGSLEDRYASPGNAVTRPDRQGQERLLLIDGDTTAWSGDGASAEGERPFIDRWNLATGAKQRVFQSAPPGYEAPLAALDNEGRRWLSTRESPESPPNFFLRTLGQAEAPLALTQVPHPLPGLRGVIKRVIHYQRADGVQLSGTLYLPAGYDAQRDGPLPALLWAYPQEFLSAASAGQVSGSAHRYTALGPGGPEAFVAVGYAVLDTPSMPIIGSASAPANDSFVPQLVANAQAAVDELVRLGVGDRQRMAIGGHSFGAFMTANLLAHTRLFRAGIARSGAYNRTLTPFGYQAEERNFWQAQASYLAVSPFNHADRIKDALLLMHGEQDSNTGTFALQSERMFAALRGLGGTARLVMLPYEDHRYRARESILHMLAESHEWLDRHVKPVPPLTTPQSLPAR